MDYVDGRLIIVKFSGNVGILLEIVKFSGNVGILLEISGNLRN